jgi:eukaryotic-like serine/threonine-protein kinase
VARFRAEAQIVSRLSHPHTIAVFDFGEIDDGSGFYLAMEYVPGKDLAAALRDAGRFPEERVARIGRQILGSLGEAHEAGIVHRDVKPGNVMLVQTRSGEDHVKVLDFGIAKLRDEGSGADAGATSAGAILGTPSYLAPEQARGEPLDGRTDSVRGDRAGGEADRSVRPDRAARRAAAGRGGRGGRSSRPRPLARRGV